MEFLEVLKKRKSTRKFLDKDVSEALVNEIIELANSSPSAGNIQARSVIVVKDQNTIEKIRSFAHGLIRFEGKIPLILVILARTLESAERYAERGKNLYALQDATIFTAYLQLITTAKGLSTCWVGSFNENEIKTTLQLPKGFEPVAMLPLGYASEQQPKPQDRKSLSELILKTV